MAIPPFKVTHAELRPYGFYYDSYLVSESQSHHRWYMCLGRDFLGVINIAKVI